MAARVPFFVLAIALLLINTHATLNLDSEKHEASVEFSYSGSTGPENWGSLDPNFATCSTGKSQSPVDIVTNKAALNKKLKPLKREYQTVKATLVNHGYSIGLEFGDAGAGVLNLDGKNYTLKQLHWHSPSEHKIDGVSCDAELHLVHKASDGSISVIGILYKIGDADPILTKIQSNLAELAKEECGSDEQAHIDIGPFDAWKLRRNTRKYYRYIGSLTTPPCSENVIWNVFPKVRSISKAQVEALKAPLLSGLKSNSRPVQPLNTRQVELFDELA